MHPCSLSSRTAGCSHSTIQLFEGACNDDGNLLRRSPIHIKLPEGEGRQRPSHQKFSLRLKLSIEGVSTYENTTNIAPCTPTPTPSPCNLLFFSFRALFTVRSNSPLVRPPTPKATRLFIKTVEFSPHDTFKMKAFAALSFFVTLAAQVAALTVNTP